MGLLGYMLREEVLMVVETDHDFVALRYLGELNMQVLRRWRIEHFVKPLNVEHE